MLRRQRWTRAKRNTKVFYLLQHMMKCAECGFLMGGSANTKKEVKRNGKVYKYEMNPPRRYYRCYGYQQMRLQCRAKPMIRAERTGEPRLGRGQECPGESRPDRRRHRGPERPGGQRRIG